MFIKEINLNGFRNYNNQNISFINGINLFIGDNAQGKTNIIEAIYLSAFAKSYRTIKDLELINFDKEYTRINLEYSKKNIEKSVELFIDKLGNKLIKYDDIKINKISSIIGEIILVVFSPDDLNIVKGAPSSRRKFIDMICCQISKSYIINLQEYNKCLKIKNNLLKKNITIEDKEYIYVLNEKMSFYIEKITEFRKEILKKILYQSKNIHLSITENKEEIKFEYISEFIDLDKEKIRHILNNNINIDIYRKTSTKGLQKDDIIIYINDFEVNKFGSQGQNRTALLTLKLANFEVLKELKEETPILLLDDIMSELDNKRINFLLKYIENYQSIITTTEYGFIDNFKNIKISKILNGHLQNQ
ncbi:MAG: DNA replication/repair protein RecF [Clostridia bacterium]|nr:DNA replication/repair protein RecF [Clostridia bacterium]MDD4386337.1 DNA replication/repair protein RecF [Clostridia bacterium]